MSGSGLIYAAVLGAWGAYLLSRCLRSAGGASAAPPVEGTLLRRRGASDPASASYSMLRPAAGAAEPVVKRRAVEGSAPVVLSRRDPVGPATARPRRRAVRRLLAAVALTLAVALAGLVPIWAPGIPALLLGTYLVELRTGVRRSRAPLVGVAPASAAHGKRRGLRAARRADSADDRADDGAWADPWPDFDASSGSSSSVAETAAGTVPDLAAGWEPRPVPLPTYVTAPKAPAVPGRRIDVTGGRQWAGVDDEDTQELPRLVLPDTDLDGAASGDVDIEHKRAVGD